MRATLPPPAPVLVVIGASVRAFACSAARAGWAVHAADLFGDADLRAAAAGVVTLGDRPRRYPDGLLAAVGGFPAAPWCYTGAVENHPDVIARLAAERPLLGTTAEAARAVRDHRRLAAAVRRAGLGFPDTFDAPDAIPRDGTHVVKPRASAGGRGIALWEAAAGERPRTDHVWQRFVAGTPWAVAYAITRAGEARLWAASRQLVGADWCRARPFAYSGSVDVPLPAVPAGIREQCLALGQALACAFSDLGLAGLVGVDMIVDAAQRVHVIEVNPRPTASMELAERTTGESLAAVHVAACGGAAPASPPASSPGGSSSTWAKAVLFADRDRIIDGAWLAGVKSACRPAAAAEEGAPLLADVPRLGTRSPAAAPIVTVFAAATEAAEAVARLRQRVARIAAV